MPCIGPRITYFGKLPKHEETNHSNLNACDSSEHYGGSKIFWLLLLVHLLNLIDEWTQLLCERVTYFRHGHY
jgi:hypothetical protein